MSEPCTIFGRNADFRTACAALKAICPTAQVCGSESAWERIAVERAGTRITCSSLVKEVPQDKFSLTILGAFTAAERLATRHPGDHDALLRRIASTAMIVGMVAEPEIDGFAADCISALAKALEGIVFNGDDFMDADGDVLLGVPE